MVLLSSENATYHLTALVSRVLDKYYHCQDKYWRCGGQMDKYVMSAPLRKLVLKLKNFPNVTEAFGVQRVESPVQPGPPGVWAHA